ncbi:hypothetical protein RRG08_016448 [Elysia crispata]|uniref:Uncharacterized protein n=1 Tax=Elysia crispata TaxID=231223 RepID=A0AAE0Y9M6_9GAST|nr:hypothetical protein RRG08_016448 [Elysia crispata]
MSERVCMPTPPSSPSKCLRRRAQTQELVHKKKRIAEITHQGIGPVSESSAMITPGDNTSRNRTSEREQGDDNPRR